MKTRKMLEFELELACKPSSAETGLFFFSGVISISIPLFLSPPLSFEVR